MTKRVLVLNHFALPRSSAGGTRHVELFGRLSDRWSAQVLAGNRNLFDQSAVESEGVLVALPVTPYSGNGLSRVLNWVSFAVVGLLAGLRAPKPDVVYGSSPHLLAALAGWVVAALRRSAFVLEVRDLWPQILADAGMMPESSVVYRILKGLERFLYRRADRIVVLAGGSIDAIVAEGIERSKIELIPNGADPADFDVNEDREALRSDLGFDGFVAVYAGAHGPANGLDLVLDAAAELRDSDINVVLFGDGVVKAELVERARSEGLSNVHFRDPVSKEQIKRVFAAADVGLHSLADVELFKSAVSPNKLYDYMAAGLPVLTNTEGEVGDMVERAESGLVVGPTGLADGLRRFADVDASTRATFGSNGKRFMEAKRSRGAMARRLEDLLDTVCR